MTEEQEIAYVNISTDNKFFIHQPKLSNWTCYMFGNRPDVNTGIAYIPQEGRVPNRFVRFMMRICFDCLWVEEK